MRTVAPTNPRRTGWLPAVSLIGVAGLIGCGSQPPRLSTYPVHGQVTCAGKPAVGVHVFLRRADGASVPEMPMNPRARTGPDGQFTMTTYDKNDGAPAGDYV